MDRSAIILMNGTMSKQGDDRALWKLNDKPILAHVVDAVKHMVDEVIVVANSKEQADNYAKALSSANVKFVLSNESEKPLSATLKGFEVAQGKYSLLLPFDMPFVSKDVVSLLFDCCVGKSAVVPRWPNLKIEPLYAVYCTELALAAAKEVVARGELDLDAMVCKLRGVRYLSTLVVEQLDPDFCMFLKVKSSLDMKKAITIAKPKKPRSQ